MHYLIQCVHCIALGYKRTLQTHLIKMDIVYKVVIFCEIRGYDIAIQIKDLDTLICSRCLITFSPPLLLVLILAFSSNSHQRSTVIPG